MFRVLPPSGAASMDSCALSGMTGPTVRGATSEERIFLLQVVVYPLVVLGL